MNRTKPRNAMFAQAFLTIGPGNRRPQFSRSAIGGALPCGRACMVETQ